MSTNASLYAIIATLSQKLAEQEETIAEPSVRTRAYEVGQQRLNTISDLREQLYDLQERVRREQDTARDWRNRYESASAQIQRVGEFFPLEGWDEALACVHAWYDYSGTDFRCEDEYGAPIAHKAPA